MTPSYQKMEIEFLSRFLHSIGMNIQRPELADFVSTYRSGQLERERERNNISKERQLTFPNSRDDNWLIIPHADGFSRIYEPKIIRIEAQNNYSKIILDHNEDILIAKTLKYIQAQLNSDIFIRIHRTHIINLAHLRTYKKIAGGVVVMKDNSEVPVARRRLGEFIRRMRG